MAQIPILKLTSALVLVVLLAGCADPVLNSPHRGPWSVMRSSILPGDVSAREPMVSIDGKLIAIAGGAPDPQTTYVGPILWVSQDGGESFSLVKVPTSSASAEIPPADVDVMIVDGVIFVATMWETHFELASSKDGGKTWTIEPLVQSLPIIDRPWLVRGPGAGDISVVYVQTGSGTWLATRTANAYQQHLIVTAADLGGCACSPGRPTVDVRSGALLVPFPANAEFLGGTQDIRMARSTDASWSTFAVSPVTESRGKPGGSGIVSMASIPGWSIVVWPGVVEGGRTVLWTSLSNNGGTSWAAPVPIPAENETISRPLVATSGNQGFIFASYASHLGGDREWRPHVIVVVPENGTLALRGEADAGPVVEKGNLGSSFQDFLSAGSLGQNRVGIAYVSNETGQGKIFFAQVV